MQKAEKERRKGAGEPNVRKPAPKSLLAALAALLTSFPSTAAARPAQGMVPQVAEKPPLEGVGDARSGREMEFNGGRAIASILGEEEDFTIMHMEYDMKNLDLPGFDFYAPKGTRKIQFNLPGAERSVVITENNVIVTLGYAAAGREARDLVMERVRPEGEVERVQLRGNTYYWDLPEDLRGYEQQGDEEVPKLLSACIAEDPSGGGATLFLLGRDGHLRATRVERFSEPFAHANPTISGDAVLMNAGTVALLAQPGRNSILALSAVFNGDERSIEGEVVPLPAAPEGRPEIRVRNRELILSFDNMQLLVLVGEQGNPHSVTIATAPR